MTEPTVQVPVSLIEGMPHDYLCRSHQGALCDCYRAEFVAFLSQPTPPRIEDLAPETTCGEDVSGTVPSWAGEDQISPCKCVLILGHDGPCKCSHQVASSTIRDVREPKEDYAV